MSDAALDHAPSIALRPARYPRPLTRIRARLSGPSLDREFAAGVASWRSALHAARALQLTSDRNRRSLARSLERLIEVTDDPAPRISAAIAPSAPQVRAALPLILSICAELRGREPIDARGVVRLRALLSDGGGPCYIATAQPSLSEALSTAARWLAVAGA